MTYWAAIAGLALILIGLLSGEPTDALSAKEQLMVYVGAAMLMVSMVLELIGRKYECNEDYSNEED